MSPPASGDAAWPPDDPGWPAPELPFSLGNPAGGPPPVLLRSELAALAAELLDRLARLPGGGDAPGAGRMAIVAEDRALFAAALLASLAGGPELVLPHALSAPQLAEAAAVLPFATALLDRPRELPDGPAPLLLQPSIPEKPRRAGWPASRRPPGQPFLHLFTGGSTGHPRLWSKTPANLLGEAAWLARRFGIGPQDRILATVPPCHIYGLLFSVALPLVSGAAVVCDTVFYPREIAERSRALGCTVLVSVPAHFRALAAAGVKLGDLRLVFSSGALLQQHEEDAFRQATGLGITEVYGSTETGGIATRCRAAGETGWTAFPVLRWRLAGELLAVDSPFLSPELARDGDGFFCTGDRAAPDPSGGGNGFVLLGRADGIVKVGGKRVDLAEVEEKLAAIPGVQEAHVYALPDPGSRGESIAALVVAALTPGEILEALRTRLPPQALPRRLRRVEQLPLTPAGKRDREAAEKLLGS